MVWRSVYLSRSTGSSTEGDGDCGPRAVDSHVARATAVAAVFLVSEADIAPCLIMPSACHLVTTGLLVRESDLRFAVRVEGKRGPKC